MSAPKQKRNNDATNQLRIFLRKQVYLHWEQHNKLSMRYDTNDRKTFTTFIFC